MTLDFIFIRKFMTNNIYYPWLYLFIDNGCTYLLIMVTDQCGKYMVRKRWQDQYHID